MRFLLLLVWVVFFFLFFLFSKIPELEWFFIKNLFYEANIYVGISLLFLLFTIKSFRKNWETDTWNTGFLSSIFSLQLWDIENVLKFFFSHIVHYIAIGLFYGAFFLLFGEIFWNISLPQIFIFFNILVCTLFLFEKKISLFWDLLRVNTSIISLYYIFFHALYLFWGNIHISLYDLGNIIGVFLLLYLFLYRSSYMSHKKLFYSYAISFFFLESLVFLSLIFWKSLELWMIVSCLFGAIFSFWIDAIKQYLSIPRTITRIFILLFFSFSVFSGIWLIFWWERSLFISIITVTVASVFLWWFHYYFQNYLAALGASLWTLGIIYGISSLLLQGDFIYLYSGVIYILFSFFLLVLHKSKYMKYSFDMYFFHTLSLFVNLVWVILFLFFVKSSILLIASLLLIESVYYSLLYYRFKK